MRFILRKYVDASHAAEALAQDPSTPVHDVYLKDGEEPRRGGNDEKQKDLIGFVHDTPIGPYEDEPTLGKKR